MKKDPESPCSAKEACSPLLLLIIIYSSLICCGFMISSPLWSYFTTFRPVQYSSYSRPMLHCRGRLSHPSNDPVSSSMSPSPRGQMRSGDIPLEGEGLLRRWKVLSTGWVQGTSCLARRINFLVAFFCNSMNAQSMTRLPIAAFPDVGRTCLFCRAFSLPYLAFKFWRKVRQYASLRSAIVCKVCCPPSPAICCSMILSTQISFCLRKTLFTVVIPYRPG